MSNIFKQNSRFAALVEEDSQPKKVKKDFKDKTDIDKKDTEGRINSFKKETEINGNYNSFKERGREDRFRHFGEKESQKSKEERLIKENDRKLMEKLEKERLEQESLKIDNFPSLVDNGKKNDIKETKAISYLEKIKHKKNVDSNNNSLDPDISNLKPGWVMFKKDIKTGKTIIKTHPSTSYPEKPKHEKSQAEIGRDILKALVDLHEKRTKEYIETFGEYAWEKMFKRPRWREEEAENMTDSDESDDDYEYENENDDDDDYYGY